MAKKASTTYEEIFIPKAQANEDKTWFISVNGRSVLVPRGKTISVPAEIAWEIRRSLKAQDIQERNSQEMLEQTK